MRRIRQYTAEQFLKTARIFNSSFSHDEKSILITSNESGVFNAYVIPIDGGRPRPLTESTVRNTYAISYFPHDQRMLLSRDQDGDENYHLYVMDADGREQDLTHGDNVRSGFLAWGRDGRSFYYMANERDRRFFDIYKIDAADFSRKLLYQNTEGYQFCCISNDEAYIALVKPHTRADSDIYLYSLATKETKLLTPHAGDIIFRAACFDVWSNYLYYLTDEGSELSYVMRYDLVTGKKLIVEEATGDILDVNFSHNGRYRAARVSQDARTVVRVQDQATNQLVLPSNMPDGEIAAVKFSRSERFMTFYVDSDRSPRSLYLCDLTTGRVRKLIDSLNPEIDPADLVESEAIRYPSFDGMEIPALLWKPHRASSGNKAPALVWVHGGPGGQTRKGYNGKIQCLVNHGYVVLGVNNRGSAGYGKTFLAADDRKHGREPLWDCIEAKKYLASLDYVDGSKIGIIGASYGGYMVLAALAFHPEEFAVGIDLFGISNWPRTITSFPPYWAPHLERYYRKVGNPHTEEEALRAISPLFHSDKITKPIMIMQGANDVRVLKAESDEMVEAIRKNHGIVEYLVFADEGHGFSKKVNKIRAYRAIIDFLGRHLKGTECSE